MPFSSGDQLGPYSIVEPIGAGGMGDVYKARDTRLDRTVAIKVSKEEFTERFDREARAVGALNHPYICTLHDVGPNYLVFEYVEGQPLKGPLPLDKALAYAAQICDALDAAHSRKIVHRDLKPANILVTKSGVKLLDFGLAKIEKPIAVEERTVTMGLTAKGQILGTLTYMAPEQLQGLEADTRSDIFSFGCVLYEMLTGKRAFEGASAASVIAAILERPSPSIAEIAPPALDRVLKRCMEKDPENRWQTARDLKSALELASVTAAAATVAPKAPSRSFGGLSWAVSGVLALALAAVGWIHFSQRPPAAEPVRFQVLPPQQHNFVGAPAVSPDGRKVAFVTRDVNNRPTVWVRSLDSLDAKEVTSANENGAAMDPFWSPDSRFLGYAADNKLKRVDSAGGPPQVLCDYAGVFNGGAWSSKGVIVFSLWSSVPEKGGLWSVPETGGVAAQLASIPGPQGSAGTVLLAFGPRFLPDGEHFLYSRYSLATVNTSLEIYAASAAGKAEKPKRLLSANSQASFVPSSPGGDQGQLLFLRGNALYAQPFDASKLATAGEATPVISTVGLAGQSGETGRGNSALFSVSDNGVLAYRPGSTGSLQLTWLNRHGMPLGSVGEAGGYTELDLSPDGKRLAAVRDGDIWILELDRNVTTRFTLDGRNNRGPVWSRDGSRIAFESDRNGKGAIFVKMASGGEQELLYQADDQDSPTDFAPDGLVFTSTSKTGTDVFFLPLVSGFKPAPPARAMAQTQFQEGQARISPDGRWMVYISGEGGKNEAYVRPFPNGDAKWLVSQGTGVEARWRGDSRELYYRAGDRMMAVEINPGATPQPGEPKELFQAPIVGAGGYNRNPSYVVTRDGQKFLAVLAPAENRSEAMTVVLNWQAGSKK